MREDLRPKLAAVVLRLRELGQVEQLDNSVELLRLSPGVNPGEAFGERIVAPRRARTDHATHHRDAQLGALLPQPLERAQLGGRLVLGVLAHRAGVEHHQLRVARLIGLLKAEPLQPGRQLRAVGGVDLAADGPNVKLRHRRIPRESAAGVMLAGGGCGIRTHDRVSPEPA